jgi:hypothetical protein
VVMLDVMAIVSSDDRDGVDGYPVDCIFRNVLAVVIVVVLVAVV